MLISSLERVLPPLIVLKTKDSGCEVEAPLDDDNVIPLEAFAILMLGPGDPRVLFTPEASVTPLNVLGVLASPTGSERDF